jgi:CBS domain-containing protein
MVCTAAAARFSSELAINPREPAMTIAKLCRRDVVAVDADASPITAANLMRDNHVGALVVTEGNDPPRVIGVVTDRDLVIEVLARGLDPLAVSVGKLTQGALIDVPASASVRETLEAMQLGGVRRVLVVQEDGSVLGIVSADDLVGSISGDLESLALALRCGFGREIGERKPIMPGERELRPMFVPSGQVAMQ